MTNAMGLIIAEMAFKVGKDLDAKQAEELCQKFEKILADPAQKAKLSKSRKMFMRGFVYTHRIVHKILQGAPDIKDIEKAIPK